MLLFYAASETAPRLNYILYEILKRRLDLDYKITDSEDYFITSRSPKIYYGSTLMQDAINVPSCNLLYEEDIRKMDIRVTEEHPWRYIFFKEDMKGEHYVEVPHQHVSFDVFAASFFLLSRYEEYLPNRADKHGRFMPESSLAFRSNFLELPLVDIWVQNLALIIEHTYPQLKVKQSQYRHINTFDLDFPFRYRYLGNYRLFKKAIGSLLRGDLTELKKQMKVMRLEESDPYDTYNLIRDSQKKSGRETKFFLLLSEKETVYDKNPSPRNEAFTIFLKELSDEFECGLHPSYYSSLNEKVFADELSSFIKITGKHPESCRSHFLKLNLPGTYRRLIRNNVKADYSMAYSTHPGFRASSSFAFAFFDVMSNESTSLMVYPACIMDTTFTHTQNSNPLAAMYKGNQLKSEVKRVGGTFICILHNVSLCNQYEWTGWREAFLDWM